MGEQPLDGDEGNVVWAGYGLIDGQPRIVFENKVDADLWANLDSGLREVRRWGVWSSFEEWAFAMHDGKPPATTPLLD